MLLLFIAIVLLLIDFIYIYLSKNYFNNQIKIIQGSPIQINVVGVILCYILLTFGLYYFIIQPHKSVKDAFILGIIIYGVFDTTNYALFNKWSIKTLIMDTLWGGILFAITTFIINKLRK
jgi:uncharacterized membrane protein